eukprot:6204545-Pleurochrysis_carterae.AAC.4
MPLCCDMLTWCVFARAVQEREDGKNCNGWHWTETDLTGWSEDNLKEKLDGIVVSWPLLHHHYWSLHTYMSP